MTLCPDCAERMSGYGRKEYNRGLKRWRDIWYCYKEKKWWERRGEWIRRFDLEGAEEPGACQTETRCPVCRVEGDLTLIVVKNLLFVKCGDCGYAVQIDMTTLEGIEMSDHYFEFSTFKSYTLCPDVACAPYKVHEWEKLHSLCYEYWHCPIMKYMNVLCEVELPQELVEKVKPKVEYWLGKMEEHTKGWLKRADSTWWNNKSVAAYKWFIFRAILERGK